MTGAMRSLGLLALLMVASPAVRAEDPITLYFNDRPPFKMRLPDGSVGGITAGPAAAAFAAAHIPVVWADVPASRQIDAVKNATTRTCAVGFYKTAQREAFAKFTDAVSTDGALTIFARKGFTVADHTTLEDLLAHKDYRIVIKQSNSYGDVIDRAISQAAVSIERIASNYDTIVKMIINGRSDFTFISPEEITYYEKALNFDASAYRILDVAGLPPGERRHLMCSKGVEDGVIARFNAALAGK